jgi:D-glycero-D-manno-heptose 1,7-bisphosphate phosphatase
VKDKSFINNRAVFLDRDGIINVDHDYVSHIKNFEFIPTIFDICKLYQSTGYRLFIITNQSGIGRGYYTETDFFTLTDWMIKQLEEKQIFIQKVYHCPHHVLSTDSRYSMDCSCRKPKPGMIENAVKEFSIDVSGSILIGDKITDVQAGISAGIGLNLLIPRNAKEKMKHPLVKMFDTHEMLLEWLKAGSSCRREITFSPTRKGKTKSTNYSSI